VAAAVLLLASACSSEDSADDVIVPAVVGSETYELGQRIYNVQCAACHGINGEGQFPNAPLERDITGRYGAPPHDETGHTWHHDDDLLIQITKEGGMGDPVNFYVMPAFESILSDREIEAVIAYIKTMWTPEQQAMQRENTLSVRSQES
jgi:mono/diheme cytochrome c family protein